MKGYLFAFICLFIMSCNESGKKVNEVVNIAIDGSSAELQAENAKLKEYLSLRYQNLLKSSTDTVLKSRANILFKEISQTDSFIDSLQDAVKQLNREDVESVKVIKNFLAEGNLGDSLHNCLNNTFQQAKDFSVNQEQKKAIDSIKTNMFNPMRTGKSWQEELFGMTNPLGASLILFGLQKELYNVGKIAFEQ